MKIRYNEHGGYNTEEHILTNCNGTKCPSCKSYRPAYVGLATGRDVPVFQCFGCGHHWEDKKDDTTYLDNALDYSFDYAISPYHKRSSLANDHWISAKQEPLTKVKWRFKYSLLNSTESLEAEIAEMREKAKLAKKVNYGWNKDQTKTIRKHYGRTTFEEVISDLLRYLAQLRLFHTNIPE